MAPNRIDRVLGFEHGVPPVYGVVAGAVGIVYLLLGWRLHRVTVVVTGFLLGAFVGQLLARWIQVDRAWGVWLGGAAVALLADPLHKAMVFVLAGTALGLGLGEGVRLLVASGGFLWGLVPGFVAGGLLSLWQLRYVVILSTSFLGSLLFFWGISVVLCNLVYAPVCTFHLQHPVLSWILIGLGLVAGLATQLWLSDRRRQAEEM